jgi:hypothetical protein
VSDADGGQEKRRKAGAHEDDDDDGDGDDDDDDDDDDDEPLPPVDPVSSFTIGVLVGADAFIRLALSAMSAISCAVHLTWQGLRLRGVPDQKGQVFACTWPRAPVQEPGAHAPQPLRRREGWAFAHVTLPLQSKSDGVSDSQGS